MSSLPDSCSLQVLQDHLMLDNDKSLTSLYCLCLKLESISGAVRYAKHDRCWIQQLSVDWWIRL